MLRQTPLYSYHLALNGRMVDFAGWALPVQYSSQLQEHKTVRHAAGMFDVSHMKIVDICGQDAQAFLLHCLSNDIRRAKTPGKAIYTCLLNDLGGVIDDLLVYHFSSTQYRLIVNAACAEKDILWLNTQKLQFANIKNKAIDLEISPKENWALIAVQGPAAMAKIAEAMPMWADKLSTLGRFVAFDCEATGAMVARTGYTGEDGCEIAIPGDQAADLWQKLTQVGVAPCGLGARDTLRLEAGMNLYGHEMDETILPDSAGLNWVVDMRDEARDFVGKAALLSARKTGNLAQQIGIILQEKGVLRENMRVITSLGEGITTSGSFSPMLERGIAFARVPAGNMPIGSLVQIEVRGKLLNGECVALPFVQKSY